MALNVNLKVQNGSAAYFSFCSLSFVNHAIGSFSSSKCELNDPKARLSIVFEIYFSPLKIFAMSIAISPIPAEGFGPPVPIIINLSGFIYFSAASLDTNDPMLCPIR